MAFSECSTGVGDLTTGTAVCKLVLKDPGLAQNSRVLVEKSEVAVTAPLKSSPFFWAASRARPRADFDDLRCFGGTFTPAGGIPRAKLAPGGPPGDQCAAPRSRLTARLYGGIHVLTDRVER